MASLNGDFMDAQNIVIMNDVPYFSFKGNSYLEKLKNGLSLDYVFFMEDSAIKTHDNDEESFEENNKQEKQYQPLKHELFDEEYDIDVIPMPRKGKNIIKLRSDKNMKKNKVKQSGYNDKLHTIESNLPTIFDEAFDWHQYYSENDDDYYSDCFDDNFDEDDSDYYESYSFDSLDIYYNGNRTGRGWD
jgi:hypothetical protein